MTGETTASILASVLAASTAILGVFVFVGTPVEKRVVQRQTAAVIHSLLADAPILGAAEGPLRAYVDTLSPPDMAAEDAASAASNRALLSKAAGLVGAGLLAGLVWLRYASRSGGFALGPVLRRALISGALAAVTEVAFLLCVAQRFVSADPQYVRLMIVRALARDAA